MAAVVLDDIGEKAKPPGTRPSFIIQTKPGSEQWGYILSEPIRDYTHATTLLKATVVAGINDAGGQNPARLVRLPGSLPMEAVFAHRDHQVRAAHLRKTRLVSQDTCEMTKTPRSTAFFSRRCSRPEPIFHVKFPAKFQETALPKADLAYYWLMASKLGIPNCAKRTLQRSVANVGSELILLKNSMVSELALFGQSGRVAYYAGFPRRFCFGASLASFLRFWAVAASINSSCAPHGPRSRSLPRP